MRKVDLGVAITRSLALSLSQSVSRMIFNIATRCTHTNIHTLVRVSSTISQLISGPLSLSFSTHVYCYRSQRIINTDPLSLSLPLSLSAVYRRESRRYCRARECENCKITRRWIRCREFNAREGERESWAIYRVLWVYREPEERERLVRVWI